MNGGADKAAATGSTGQPTVNDNMAVAARGTRESEHFISLHRQESYHKVNFSGGKVYRSQGQQRYRTL